MKKSELKELIKESIIDVLSEAGKTWYTIVTLKHDEAKPVFDLLKVNKGKEAIEYLKQWDMGGENEHGMSISPSGVPWGKDDKKVKHGAYTLFWNPHFDYVGLARMGTKLKEMSTTGGVAGYNIPGAFARKGGPHAKKAMDVTKKMGYTPIKKDWE